MKKRTLKKILTNVSSWCLAFTTILAATGGYSACFLFFYEPEVPEEMEKMDLKQLISTARGNK